jgi:hypothetical protein
MELGVFYCYEAEKVLLNELWGLDVIAAEII